MSLSLPTIPPESEAFRVIQYQLQQQLNATRVKLLECYDITSISQAKLFGEFCSNMNPLNIVHAFIPTSELQQPLTDIATRGVRVNPKKGFRFRADKMLVDQNRSTIEAIHCLIALGNTQNYQSMVGPLDQQVFEQTNPNPDALMVGYHSLCVSDDNEYMIFNPAQVRTLQIVRFTGGELLNRSSEFGGKCDLCQRENAVLWCSNCTAKLCKNCDQKSHTGNRLLESHNRIGIEEAKPLMEFCPFHPNVRVDHFCPECQLPVCIECKMSGSHSKGAQLHHQLVPLKDAYFSAVRAAQDENKIYGRRRRILQEKLRDSEKRLQDVVNNSKSIEAKIMRIAQEAIASLREQSGERALLIRSTMSEIQRKLEEVDSKSNFIKDHMKLSSPLSFVRSMNIHDKVVNELRPDNDLPLPLAVEGDLALCGSLTVKPKSETIAPPGQKLNDVYFDEKNVRNLDFPSATMVTETNQPTTIATETYQTNTAPSQALPEPTPIQSSKQTKPQGTSLIRVITLTQMSLRKQQKMTEQGLSLSFEPFQGSSIIRNDETARMLYMCFPFKSTPQTHLLFSTERDGRSMKSLHQTVDNVGITAVLVKRNDFVFGGFAAAKWNSDGKPFGEKSSSFIFSLTRDTFIPYRPRIENPCYLIATPTSISFGRYDIVLSNNFDQCQAIIEHSYGIGLQTESSEAKCFLAGEPQFAADIVEVWGFFTQE